MNIKLITRIMALLMCLCVAIAMISCADNTGANDGDEPESVDLAELDIDEYVSDVKYRGLDVEAEGDEREEKLWAALIANAVISKYPDGAVEYYEFQQKAYYEYLSDGKDGLMPSDDVIRAGAEALVKKDLILRYIQVKEGIEVSDSEKQELFDKYVNKYVDDYGYRRDYIITNMADVIYASMLYDKTMEFLFEVNDIG